MSSYSTWVSVEQALCTEYHNRLPDKWHSLGYHQHFLRSLAHIKLFTKFRLSRNHKVKIAAESRRKYDIVLTGMFLKTWAKIHYLQFLINELTSEGKEERQLVRKRWKTNYTYSNFRFSLVRFGACRKIYSKCEKETNRHCAWEILRICAVENQYHSDKARGSNNVKLSYQCRKLHLLTQRSNSSRHACVIDYIQFTCWRPTKAGRFHSTVFLSRHIYPSIVTKACPKARQ